MDLTARPRAQRQAGEQAALHRDVAARRLARSRDRRQRRRGPARLPQRSAGRRAGVRRHEPASACGASARFRAARAIRAPNAGRTNRGETTGHTNVWAPFSVDDSARARLSPGEHAEQRLVRRRAQGQQPLRRVDRLPRGEERKARLALPDSAPRPVGLRPSRGAGARHGARSTDGRATSSPCRRRRDFCSCSIASTASRSGRSGTRGAGERRARRAAPRSRSRFRRKPQRVRQAGIRAQTISSTSRRRSARARSTRSKDFRVGPLFTPPSRDGTIVMPGAIGGAGWGGGAFDPRTGTIFIKATNSAGAVSRSCSPRAPTRSTPTTPPTSARRRSASTIPPRDSGAARARRCRSTSRRTGRSSAIDLNTGDTKWTCRSATRRQVRNNPLLKDP